MKRGTFRNTKIRGLADRLGVFPYIAAGMLEAIWHWVAECSPTGAIPSNAQDFKYMLESAGILHDRIPNGSKMLKRSQQVEASELQAYLIELQLIDCLPSGVHYIHDWDEHADGGVRLWLERRSLRFANGVALRKKQKEKDSFVLTQVALRSGSKSPPVSTTTTTTTTPDTTTTTDTPLEGELCVGGEYRELGIEEFQTAVFEILGIDGTGIQWDQQDIEMAERMIKRPSTPDEIDVIRRGYTEIGRRVIANGTGDSRCQSKRALMNTWNLQFERCLVLVGRKEKDFEKKEAADFHVKTQVYKPLDERGVDEL